MCDLGTPCMSSLNDTDFSNDTDLSEMKNQIALQLYQYKRICVGNQNNKKSNSENF